MEVTKTTMCRCGHTAEQHASFAPRPCLNTTPYRDTFYQLEGFRTCPCEAFQPPKEASK